MFNKNEIKKIEYIVEGVLLFLLIIIFAAILTGCQKRRNDYPINNAYDQIKKMVQSDIQNYVMEHKTPFVEENAVSKINNVKELKSNKQIGQIELSKEIYDTYTRSEIKSLNRIVEAEATNGSQEDKKNVANVIFNRIESDQFPDTIKKVIFQKNQFSPVSDKRYWNVDISEETIKACESAFTDKDTTDGALFFCNKKDVKNLKTLKWFQSLQYIMTDDIGHSFYK